MTDINNNKLIEILTDQQSFKEYISQTVTNYVEILKSKIEPRFHQFFGMDDEEKIEYINSHDLYDEIESDEEKLLEFNLEFNNAILAAYDRIFTISASNEGYQSTNTIEGDDSEQQNIFMAAKIKENSKFFIRKSKYNEFHNFINNVIKEVFSKLKVSEDTEKIKEFLQNKTIGTVSDFLESYDESQDFLFACFYKEENNINIGYHLVNNDFSLNEHKRKIHINNSKLFNTKRFVDLAIKDYNNKTITEAQFLERISLKLKQNKTIKTEIISEFKKWKNQLINITLQFSIAAIKTLFITNNNKEYDYFIVCNEQIDSFIKTIVEMLTEFNDRYIVDFLSNQNKFFEYVKISKQSMLDCNAVVKKIKKISSTVEIELSEEKIKEIEQIIEDSISKTDDVNYDEYAQYAEYGDQEEEEETKRKREDQEEEEDGTVQIGLNIDNIVLGKSKDKEEKQDEETYQTTILPYLEKNEDGVAELRDRIKHLDRHVVYARHKKIIDLLASGGTVNIAGEKREYPGLNTILNSAGGLFVARFYFILDIIHYLNYAYDVDTKIIRDKETESIEIQDDFVTFTRKNTLTDEDVDEKIKELDGYIIQLCRSVRNSIDTSFDDKLIRLYDLVKDPGGILKPGEVSDDMKYSLSIPFVSIDSRVDIEDRATAGKRGRYKLRKTSSFDTEANYKFLKILPKTGITVTSEYEKEAISRYNNSLKGKEVFKSLKLIYASASEKQIIDRAFDYDSYEKAVRAYINSSKQVNSAIKDDNASTIVDVYNFINFSYNYFIESLGIEKVNIDAEKPFDLNELADKQIFSEKESEFNETKQEKISSLRNSIEEIGKDLKEKKALKEKIQNIEAENIEENDMNIERIERINLSIEFLNSELEKCKKDLESLMSETFNITLNFFEEFIRIINQKLNSFEFSNKEFSSLREFFTFIYENDTIIKRVNNQVNDSVQSVILNNVIDKIIEEGMIKTAIDDFRQTIAVLEKSKGKKSDVFYKSLLLEIEKLGGQEYLEQIDFYRSDTLLDYIISAENFYMDEIDANYDIINIALNDCFSIMSDVQKHEFNESGRMPLGILNYIDTLDFNNLKIDSNYEKGLRIANITKVKEMISSFYGGSINATLIYQARLPVIKEEYEVNKEYFVSKEIDYKEVSQLIEKIMKIISPRNLDSKKIITSLLKKIREKENINDAFLITAQGRFVIQEAMSINDFNMLYNAAITKTDEEILTGINIEKKDIVTVDKSLDSRVGNYLTSLSRYADKAAEITADVTSPEDVYFKKASVDFRNQINSALQVYRQTGDINFNELQELIMNHSYNRKTLLGYDDIAAVVKQSGIGRTGTGQAERHRTIIAHNRLRKLYSDSDNFTEILGYLFKFYCSIVKLVEEDEEITSEVISGGIDKRSYFNILNNFMEDPDFFVSITKKPEYFIKTMKQLVNNDNDSLSQEEFSVYAEMLRDFYLNTYPKQKRETTNDYNARIKELKLKEKYANYLTDAGSTFRRFFSYYLEEYYRTQTINNERLIMAALKLYFKNKFPNKQFFQTGIDAELFYGKKGEKTENATRWTLKEHPGHDPNTLGFLLNPIIFLIQNRTFGETKGANVVNINGRLKTVPRADIEQNIFDVTKDVFEISEDRKKDWVRKQLMLVKSFRRQSNNASVASRIISNSNARKVIINGEEVFLEDDGVINEEFLNTLVNDISNPDNILGQIRKFFITLDIDSMNDIKIFIMNPSAHRTINNNLLNRILNSDKIEGLNIFKEYNSILRATSNRKVQVSGGEGYTTISTLNVDSESIHTYYSKAFNIYKRSLAESIIYNQKETDRVSTGIPADILTSISNKFFIESDIDASEFIRQLIINNQAFTSSKRKEEMLSDRTLEHIDIASPVDITQVIGNETIRTRIYYIWSAVSDVYVFGDDRRFSDKRKERILYKYIVSCNISDKDAEPVINRIACDKKEKEAYRDIVSYAVETREKRTKSVFVLDTDAEVCAVLNELTADLREKLNGLPQDKYDELNNYIIQNLYIEIEHDDDQEEEEDDDQVEEEDNDQEDEEEEDEEEEDDDDDGYNNGGFWS